MAFLTAQQLREKYPVGTKLTEFYPKSGRHYRITEITDHCVSYVRGDGTDENHLPIDRSDRGFREDLNGLGYHTNYERIIQFHVNSPAWKPESGLPMMLYS
jgi:hypothetical protein